MKLIKILMTGLMAMALVACSDEPQGESTKHKPGEEEPGGEVEKPEEPS